MIMNEAVGAHVAENPQAAEATYFQSRCFSRQASATQSLARKRSREVCRWSNSAR
jgi:hypothetical protein